MVVAINQECLVREREMTPRLMVAKAIALSQAGLVLLTQLVPPSTSLAIDSLLVA